MVADSRRRGVDGGWSQINNFLMKPVFAALGLLAAVVTLAAEKAPVATKAPVTAAKAPVAEKGYELQEVRVGKATLKLPIPKAFVAVGRDEDWSKAFYERFENLTQDPRKAVRFVFVRLTPAHLARCREEQNLGTGLDCWGTVQGQVAEREYDQAAFAKIADAVAAEFKQNGIDGVRKTIRREVKDEEFNRVLGELGSPMVIERNDRSIQFLMPSGPNLILGGYVLVEGKLFNIYLQRPKAEAREMMVMMDDWIAEILKASPATRK